jgi:hypothetical protein
MTKKKNRKQISDDDEFLDQLIAENAILSDELAQEAEEKAINEKADAIYEQMQARWATEAKKGPVNIISSSVSNTKKGIL